MWRECHKDDVRLDLDINVRNPTLNYLFISIHFRGNNKLKW